MVDHGGGPTLKTSPTISGIFYTRTVGLFKEGDGGGSAGGGGACKALRAPSTVCAHRMHGDYQTHLHTGAQIVAQGRQDFKEILVYSIITALQKSRDEGSTTSSVAKQKRMPSGNPSASANFNVPRR